MDGGITPLYLVALGLDGERQKFEFFDQIELGRFHPSRPPSPGRLLIQDQTVSSRHCVIYRKLEGCVIQDLSRNGTRVDGRRLTLNQEMIYKSGQVIQIGRDCQFIIEGDLGGTEPERAPGTLVARGSATISVLVGDIKNYTQLMQNPDQDEVSLSITRLYESLEREIWNLGGTVKEFQGDAIVAFWEASHTQNHAEDACRAALALKNFVEQTARNSELWSVLGFPLEMDWAVTTGAVTVTAFGQSGPSGLAMLGEPLTLAFRMEKLANSTMGSILVASKHVQAGPRHYGFS